MEYGGTNLLCLPNLPRSSKSAGETDMQKMSYIFGVQFQFGEANLLNAPSGNYFNAFCSVCKRHGNTATVMLPGQTSCPKGWTNEYDGFLMAPRTGLKRSKYICVDKNTELQNGLFSKSRVAGFLNFVETRCGSNDIPCRSKDYEENYEVACVVCSV